MAAKNMASCAQLAQLFSGQERWLADKVGRDKEMASPPMLLEKLADREGTGAAIIESKQQYRRTGWRRSTVQDLDARTIRRRSDLKKVGLKVRPQKFVKVGISAGKTAATEIAVDDVVIEKGQNHRFLASRFQWK